METLVKLLNEYEEDKIKNSEWLDVMNIWKCEWTLHYYNNYKDENVFDNVRYLIISKEYWFIERLVAEHKINWRKCLDLWYEISVIDTDGEDIDIMRVFDDYVQLIMYVAIQTEPIKFLTSILKIEW